MPFMRPVEATDGVKLAREQDNEQFLRGRKGARPVSMSLFLKIALCPFRRCPETRQRDLDASSNGKNGPV
jgi:hypothetical protein